MIAPASSRFSLAILMAFIGVIAVGLGGMRVGSSAAVKVAFSITLLALLVGLLGAIVRRGDGPWAGFSVFGWAYALLTFLPALNVEFGSRLPVADLLAMLDASLHPDPGPGPAFPKFNTQFMSMIGSESNIQFMNRQNSPTKLSLLSPAELTSFDAYQPQYQSHIRRSMATQVARGNAKAIGDALFTLAFGLVGAVVGRALERPRRPDPAPSGG